MAQHREGDVLYVDTDFINAIQHKVPGAELKHLGWGEFELVTPVGTVQFDRSRGKDFEGQNGRSHKVYGDLPALELLAIHGDGV